MSLVEQDIQDRLVTRIRRLSAAKLRAVEEFVARLEDGADWGSGNDGPLEVGRKIQSGVKPPQSKEIQSGVKPPQSKEIQSGVKPPQSKDWPHAPVHRISEHGTFIVTAGTLYKQHHFGGRERLDLLESKLLELAKQFGWHIEAWAVFSNHYHFVGHCRPESTKLNTFLGTLHTATATAVNQIDGTAKRQVWHNFWETKLTYERSYLARLNYVHQNPVKHGLVPVANQYRWCSAAWFERTATPAQVKTIYSFKTDKLKVLDDFDVVIE